MVMISEKENMDISCCFDYNYTKSLILRTVYKIETQENNGL
jgi:hypothetical protein